MELAVTSFCLDRIKIALIAGFQHKLAIGEASIQRAEQEVQPQTVNA